MHLSQAWMVVPGLAIDDLSALDDLLPDREHAGRSVIKNVLDLAAITSNAAAADQERDLGVLADRIDERAAAFLAQLDDHTADLERPWLVEGIAVPVALLACHLLNETVMHGRDIAIASDRPWPLSRRTANAVLDGFLLPTLHRLGRDAVDQKAAAGLVVTFDVRLREGNSYFVRIDDGNLSITPASGERVDVHLSADPLAFLLLAWGRQSQWTALCRGQLMAWGRRPWLALRFRSLLINV